MRPNSIAHIAYFGHNRRDTAFQRRVRAFLDLKVDIVSFTFRRDGEPEHPGPNWTNVDLGYVEHARLVDRIALYPRALRAVLSRRDLIKQADIIYARNLDIFVLAFLATRMATLFRRSSHRFVYECLDVHKSLTGEGPLSYVLRWIEKRVLRVSSLLVVSSPGFIEHYFRPVQKYTGDYFWVENKVYFGDLEVPRTVIAKGPNDGAAHSGNDKLMIGWVGIIRCQRTLDLLKSLAAAKPDDVIIRIAGLVSAFLIQDFDKQIANHSNIVFSGAYEWPQGLSDIYRGMDLIWAQELSWKGKNSDWLIPNRVYEASYFGVPSIGVGNTETSRIIRERKIGYVLHDDLDATLIEFLDNLDRSELRELKRKLLEMPAAYFVAGAAETTALLKAIQKPRQEHHRH